MVVTDVSTMVSTIPLLHVLEHLPYSQSPFNTLFTIASEHGIRRSRFLMGDLELFLCLTLVATNISLSLPVAILTILFMLRLLYVVLVVAIFVISSELFFVNLN